MSWLFWNDYSSETTWRLTNHCMKKLRRRSENTNTMPSEEKRKKLPSTMKEMKYKLQCVKQMADLWLEIYVKAGLWEAWLCSCAHVSLREEKPLCARKYLHISKEYEEKSAAKLKETRKRRTSLAFWNMAQKKAAVCRNICRNVNLYHYWKWKLSEKKCQRKCGCLICASSCWEIREADISVLIYSQ